MSPFVALYCASTPETLIESELFGYEDGAFTGARKKGAVGKILQANGGTLFLDKIGDMPFSLQARLLRVLQERMVTPPLRERTDLEPVVRKILATESDGGRYQVSDEILALFRQHRWPGNFRQLANLLRTAIVMAGDETDICLRHMPDDSLDDITPSELQPALPEVSAARLLAQGAHLEETAVGGPQVAGSQWRQCLGHGARAGRLAQYHLPQNAAPQILISCWWR